MIRSLLAMTTLLLGGASAAFAQSELPAERGFITTVDPDVTGVEAVEQLDMWAFEISYKPVRMIQVPVTDPKTGDKEIKLFWYLVYRTVRRPVDHPAEIVANEPQNDVDLEPMSMFVPEFLLVTDDNDGQKTYYDRVLPEVVEAIEQRERQQLLNTSEMIRPLPEAVPATDGYKNALYGVAVWEDVDPETDFFTIYFNGLSNGYQKSQGPDGNKMLLRRTLVQKYERPGDDIDQDEREIRIKGEPEWTYLPEPDPSAGGLGDASATVSTVD